tara:strand:- start:373 stop:1056 length:684 start_codon:yes stop_codon:yes gene_type:complete
MNKEIIKLEDVNISQTKREIFNNICLSIKEGDFLYLIGETGEGKSSLLKTLYAEIKIKSGNITVAGINIKEIKSSEIPVLRKKLGIVFQDFQLLTDRNIYENLKFVLDSTGWNGIQIIQNRIKEVLEYVELTGKENMMPYEISGGEQQRAAIARSLLNSPDIILADEPTGNLDPLKSDKIIQLLKKINKEGTTIVIATHDYQVIKNHPSRTIRCKDKGLHEIELHTL